MQPGYNEQIVVDNKHVLIIAVNLTTDGNDNRQLKPMIQKTQKTVQKALKLNKTQMNEKLNKTAILTDYGYFNYEGIDFY